MLKNATIAAELERIRLHDPAGQLRPRSVVESARDPGNPLHACFEWDDTAASDRYRLIQARRLIRVAVTVTPHSNLPMRAYVSLSSDRTQPAEEEELGHGGGYRAVGEVLNSASMTKVLLEDAFRELEGMEQRYARLSELAGVFQAAQAARARHGIRSRKKKTGKAKKTTAPRSGR